MLVLKIGGSIIDQDLTSIAKDLKTLWDTGEKIVLVHGGGKLVNKTADQMGIKQEFVTSVSGFRSRYTDEETLNVIEMVLAGKVNKDIVRLLAEYGIPAIGLSGIDGKIIEAEKKRRLKIIDSRGKKRFIEGDYSGRPKKINAEPLRLLLNNGYVPVLASLGLGQRHEVLNLDGDRVAAHIAVSLASEQLLILTDVKGLYLDEELVTTLPGEELKLIIKRVEKGMKKKLHACEEGLQMGLKEAVIASGLRENPVRSAIEHKECTTIS